MKYIRDMKVGETLFIAVGAVVKVVAEGKSDFFVNRHIQGSSRSGKDLAALKRTKSGLTVTVPKAQRNKIRAIHNTTSTGHVPVTLA